MSHRSLSLLPKLLLGFQHLISLEILCFDTRLKEINFSNFASNKLSRTGQYVALLLSSLLPTVTEEKSVSTVQEA